MNKDVQAATVNGFLSVIAGLAGTFITGLLLYPVVNYIFERFFEFETPGDDTRISKNDIIVHITILTWFFIATFAGGTLCSFASKKKPWLHTLILTLLVIIFLVCISTSDTMKERELFTFVLALAAIAVGFFTGAGMGRRIKKKRALHKDLLNDLLPDQKPDL